MFLKIIDETSHGRLWMEYNNLPGVTWHLEEKGSDGSICDVACTNDNAKAKRMWQKLREGKSGWKS